MLKKAALMAVNLMAARTLFAIAKVNLFSNSIMMEKHAVIINYNKKNFMMTEISEKLKRKRSCSNQKFEQLRNF